MAEVKHQEQRDASFANPDFGIRCSMVTYSSCIGFWPDLQSYHIGKHSDTASEVRSRFSIADASPLSSPLCSSEFCDGYISFENCTRDPVETLHTPRVLLPSDNSDRFHSDLAP